MKRHQIEFLLHLALVGIVIAGMIYSITYVLSGVHQELANETLFSEMLRLELAHQSRRIPANCSEDVFLQGVGDYEAGQYEAYECGPAMDDFLPARIVP